MSEIQNKEQAEKYLRGEIDADQLSEEQVELALELAENQEEPTEEPSTEEPLPEEPKDEYNFEPLDENKKVKEALEELNKYKQLYEDREGKLKSLKDDPNYRSKFFGEEIKTEVNPEKDYWDESHLAKIDTIDERQRILEEKLAEFEKRKAELDALTEKKNEELTLFQEISKLQENFGSLKTSEGFQSIDNKVAEFEKVASLAGISTDKYLTDKAYREAAISKGYKLNIAESDMSVAQKIYDVYDAYKKEKDAGYKTSLSRVFKDSPDYENFVKSKFSGDIDEDALNRRIIENSKEVKVMGKGSGGAVSDSDVERIIYEMRDISLKTNPSDKELKRYDDLEKMLDNIQIG